MCDYQHFRHHHYYSLNGKNDTNRKILARFSRVRLFYRISLSLFTSFLSLVNRRKKEKKKQNGQQRSNRKISFSSCFSFHYFYFYLILLLAFFSLLLCFALCLSSFLSFGAYYLFSFTFTLFLL